MNQTTDYSFLPRPEAHALGWDLLLPPVKNAVRDLLVRLNGATEAAQSKGAQNKGKMPESQVLSNCFLIYGDRGTGKTTVLLSAKSAVEDSSTFFGDRMKDDLEKKKSAQGHADKLYAKKVRWLNVLDLEPLPAQTNLLATLLTRILHDTLDQDHASEEHMPLRSIFEENDDSARNKLQKLINDATLMWEDIAETDTRSRANRQVAAAGIYAQFRERIVGALCALSSELGRIYGRENVPIILPIDNIDRSTDHLHAIVKLAQIVACPFLWLVMAGDRIDLETFLERAYWKELIRIGDGAGAIGKKRPGGEDESFVMARRQAAAASQKLLPPSHRIEVGYVDAQDTLRFSLRNGCNLRSPAKMPDEQTICYLLEQVEVPTDLQGATNGPAGKNAEPDDPARGQPELIKPGQRKPEVEELAQSDAPVETQPTEKFSLKFIDLLVINKFLTSVKNRSSCADGYQPSESGEVTQQSHPSQTLTTAAKYALRLPARNVIDLWQIADQVNNDKLLYDKGADNFGAEKIARTILRNVIAPSDMSSELGRCLNDDVIRRKDDRSTLLDFYENRLKVYRLVNFRDELRRGAPVNDGDWSARFGLQLYGIDRTILRIENSQLALQSEELPLLVTAWLAILHDIVSLSPKSSVVNPQTIPTAPLVEATHRVVRPVKTGRRCALVETDCQLRWPAPKWSVFLAHDLFRLKWEKCLENLAKGVLFSADNKELGPWLVYCWIACAMETCAIFMPQLGPVMNTLLENPPTADLPKIREELATFRQRVVDCANDLYAEVRTKEEQFSGEKGSVVNQWVAMMRDWFELGLPLLLSYPYSPFPDFETKWTTQRASDQLVEVWRKNETYIKCRLYKSMQELFVTKENADITAPELLEEFDGWPIAFKEPLRGLV